jgi:SAM-dependent methyltransferase
MAQASDLAMHAAAVPDVYERQGPRFDRDRPKRLHERVWLDRFTALMPPGGHVLDLGCGGGEPIARHLMAEGFRVTGVDVAHSMLALVRARFPEGDWRHGDMRTLDLPERFDGILGWNSFFHLTAAAQRPTLRRIARHLGPGGALMVTVGPSASEAIGQVGEEPIYHASLAPDDYRTTLAELGLDVVRFTLDDPECDRQTVLLAQKRRSRSRLEDTPP